MLGLAFGRSGACSTAAATGRSAQSPASVAAQIGISEGSHAYLAEIEQGSPVSSRFATQIYEMVGVFILAIFLEKYFKYKKNNGEVFVLMCILYSVIRFLNEFLRDEPAFMFGLTTTR